RGCRLRGAALPGEGEWRDGGVLPRPPGVRRLQPRGPRRVAGALPDPRGRTLRSCRGSPCPGAALWLRRTVGGDAEPAPAGVVRDWGALPAAAAAGCRDAALGSPLAGGQRCSRG